MKLILTLSVVLGLLIPFVYAEETSEKKVINDPAAEQKVKHIEICTHNLNTIGKAIQSYHKEHGDYPEWLSALFPKHLVDTDVLICPADKSGGKALYTRAIDPNKSLSYGYEFVTAQRKQVQETRTMFGDAVPLIRCWHHDNGSGSNSVNLSFEYKVYQSPYAWHTSLDKIYGNVEVAIKALENGIQKIPSNQQFFYSYPILLDLYMKVERKVDAENLINNYKTIIDSNNVSHSSHLGNMLRAMSRHDEELQLYEDLEKQNPKNRSVLQRLEGIHKLRGNDELAFEYKKKYVPGLAFLGEMAPDFSATDLDGKPISIEAYRGKVVLMDFWAVWCGPCIAEMPNVKKIYEAYKDKGFDIVGISLDTDETRLREYLKENEIPWRQVFSGKGWDSPVSRQYGIYGIPTMWLIDREGKLISNNARGEKLESLVAAALADKPTE